VGWRAALLILILLTGSKAWAQHSEICGRLCASLVSADRHQCVVECIGGQQLDAAPPATRQGGAAATGRAGEPPVTHGSIYLATPPNMSFGLVVGQRDRLTANRMAEASCRRAGASCVLAQDFTLPCAAIVEGVRRVTGALFMTNDPTTYDVRAITHGVANNPADAGRAALDTCRQRERGGLTCRIVFAECGHR